MTITETSNESTPTKNQAVTSYEAATHLLSLPGAKLSNPERKACRAMRILDCAARPVEVAGLDRASRRRAKVTYYKTGGFAPLPPKERKPGAEKLQAKLKEKTFVQLALIIMRGNRRAEKATRLAAKAKAPKIADAYRQAARAFRRTAVYAQCEAESRMKGQTPCKPTE